MPTLKSSHWLIEMYHINFLIFCLTRCAVLLGEPYFLRFLLTNRLNSHSLCSLSFNPLVVPCFKKIYNGIGLFFFRCSLSLESST